MSPECVEQNNYTKLQLLPDLCSMKVVGETAPHKKVYAVE
jgi:hypothetical protein